MNNPIPNAYDKTLRIAPPDYYDPARSLALMAAWAGAAGIRFSREGRISALYEFARVAIGWVKTLTNEDVKTLAAAEYARAHDKHAGRTPYNAEATTHDDCAAILIEEVGEVARAITPDADTPTGHGGNLVEELIQTITMALAWAARP